MPRGVSNRFTDVKSNVELHLQPGAVLRFSDDPKEYPVVVSRWEGVKREVYASCIYADGAENIAITGFGTIDGQGQKWWDVFRNHPEQLEYPRPKLISLIPVSKSHCEMLVWLILLAGQSIQSYAKTSLWIILRSKILQTRQILMALIRSLAKMFVSAIV